MVESRIPDLGDVAKTLLLPLCIRAVESRQSDALLHDDRAVALVSQLDPELAWFKQANINVSSQLALVLRSRQFDSYTRDFLVRCPDSTVVHVGCGLDSRFERVDNGLVDWLDLDLPEVIALRRKLIGHEGPRHHFLAGSVFDSAWLEAMSPYYGRPFLFLIEGVLMYFQEASVRSLVLTLCQHFPGAELVFDAFSPFFVWANNLRVSRTGIGALARWGLKRGQDVERWADGIFLLDEWFPFLCREPRLEALRWVRFIPLLARVEGVYRYRLGKAV